MEIVHGWSELESRRDPTDVVLTIGTFDGLHKGHQALLEHLQKLKGELSRSGKDTKANIKTALVTFSKPPRSLIEGQNPSLITSLELKCALLKSKVDILVILPFDDFCRELSSRDFLMKIHCRFPIRALVLGEKARFGKNQEGTQEAIEKIGKELGFTAHYLHKTRVNGQVVSSRTIRERIRAGDFAGAKEMLGRDYLIQGKVQKGKALGSAITSIKTANLGTGEMVVPPRGVYCVCAGTSDGRMHPAVANLGVAPTLQKGREVLCEVHLLDGEFSLYSQELIVSFHHFLRPEKCFATVEDLKKQIQIDVGSARAFWQNSHLLNKSG